MQLVFQERERHQTAELVDRQAKEMLELFKASRSEYSNLQYPSTPPPPVPPSCSKREIYTTTDYFSVRTLLQRGNIRNRMIADNWWSGDSLCSQRSRLVHRSHQNSVVRRKIRCWRGKSHLSMDHNQKLEHDGLRWLDSERHSYGPAERNQIRNRELSRALQKTLQVRLPSPKLWISELIAVMPVSIVLLSKDSQNLLAISLDTLSTITASETRGTQSSWMGLGVLCSVTGERDIWCKLKMCAARNRYFRNFRNAKDGSHEAKTDGNLRYEYDDHYFMTDPEEFIYEFYPSDPAWQLLPRPLSLLQFERIPFVRSLFFKYNLSFIDNKLESTVYVSECEVNLVNTEISFQTDKTGAASISIRLPPKGDSLIFHYNLKFFDSEENTISGMSLKRFVMQSVTEDVRILSFELFSPAFFRSWHSEFMLHPRDHFSWTYSLTQCLLEPTWLVSP